MKISIIIAVKEFNAFLRDCLVQCLRLAYDDYEILVLPDTAFTFGDDRVRIIPTGTCLPAAKRDRGARDARGEILAFIDDDAYPCEQWLANAVKNFNDPETAAVGGPAVTPPTERGAKQASGLVYESFAVSGTFQYRYKKGKRQYVDDYPSCNLLVRKSVFEQIGGFQTKFWPGEDTILCLEITKNLKKRILYDPEVIVFHHRRALFEGHLRQISSYALHRGYFVKHFPQTSFKWQYFVPSAFLLWLILGIFFYKAPALFLLFLFSLFVYAALVVLGAYQKDDIKLSSMVSAGIFLTHVAYGFYFILGLLKPKLKEEF